MIGGTGTQPLVAFQPVGGPRGAEAEGPNDLAFTPEQFPDYLQNGVFVGMHGRSALGGVENEENPLVFVDLEDNSFVHFISNEEPNIGHIDGLLTTPNSLYLADISDGGFSLSSNNTGTIYRLRSTLFDRAADVNLDGRVNAFDADVFCSLSAEERLDALDEVGFFVGDVDFDGQVSFADFLVLSENFGQQFEPGHYSRGDFDCNGEVAFVDFLVLSANFGSGTVASVPEPGLGYLPLLLCLAIQWLVRHRRQLQ